MFVLAHNSLQAQNARIKTSKVDLKQKSTYQFGEQPERVMFESKKNSSTKKSVENKNTQSIGQSNNRKENNLVFDSPQPSRISKKEE